MMNIKTEVFIEDVIDILPSLRAAYDEILAEWAPDKPPVTTVLSELGRQFADDFDQVSPSVISAVCYLIEDAMTKSDKYLSTVVATGMIEAMVNRAYRIGAWGRIRAQLGEVSKRHADAWASK